MPQNFAHQPNPNAPIAFQGAPGAYSDLACHEVYPERRTLPCRTFEEAIAAVVDGQAALAMIPIENSVAGRVADVHYLLPRSGLHIIAEHFAPVHHHLLALPDVQLEDLRQVRSHIHALSQCRRFINAHRLVPIVGMDTAGAAADLARSGDRRTGVIASELAGVLYGLVSLKANVEDEQHNTTRFVVLSQTPEPVARGGLTVTTILFRVRNVPAALYKALGGFATNGLNITKLESYMVEGSFSATEFYADIEGHPDDRALTLALEELAFFTEEVSILGVYRGHPYRTGDAANTR